MQQRTKHVAAPASAAVFLIYAEGEKRNKLAVWAPARTVRFQSCDHLGLKTGAEQKDSLKSSNRLNNKDKGE